ncbi:MAG: lysylphosphatidylglycerol synthase domain-containing protein [Nitrospirae bacterium]|nr:lysylphosphatidylglycerol synthase domain-containing protein [Nitrospirota bacterium]
MSSADAPIKRSDPGLFPGSGVRTGVVFTLIIGLAISTALVGYHSFSAVGGAVWRIGWGLGPIVFLHFTAIVLCGLAWRVLFSPERAARAKLLITLRWIRESINSLLPVAHVGGDIAGVRLQVLQGTGVNVASAGIVADRTVEVLSQFFFSVAGVSILMERGGNHDLLRWSIFGLMVIFPALIALLVAQRLGVLRVFERVLLKVLRKWGWKPAGENEGIHDALWEIYGSGRRLAAATFLHTLGWVLGAVQIRLALHFMGQETGWAEAFIIESLSQVVCTAAFIMPASLGAQEAGYMVVGGLFGIPPELGLALSLVKRFCDIVIGIPGLLVWQGLEGRHFLTLGRGRRSGAGTPSER